MAAELAVAAFVLVPFFWMVSVSLKPPDEPFAIPARLWPQDPTLGNYVAAFRPEFRTYFLNSLVVSLATAAVGVLIATPAAYALARFRFIGKERENLSRVSIVKRKGLPRRGTGHAHRRG